MDIIVSSKVYNKLIHWWVYSKISDENKREKKVAKILGVSLDKLVDLQTITKRENGGEIKV